MNFTDYLVKKNIISKDKLAEILSRSSETGIPAEDLLRAHGISKQEIAEAKGEFEGIATRNLEDTEVSFDVLKQIPEEAARHYKFAPLALKDGVLEVGMVNTNDIEAKEALQFISSKLNMPFKVFLVSQKDLDRVLEQYKGLTGEVTKVLGELETELSKVIEEKAPEEMLKEKGKFVEETPVTKMVAVILKHAVSGKASDVHIEPLRDKLRVRFRVDGVLYTSLFLPIGVHDAIVSRIKILTDMKLDEKRKPQDGRFEATIENREIDFRVSTLPTFFGEKVVMRVLDKKGGVKSLGDIGLSENNLKIIRDALKAPYGLILLTGPTGSGKTTTLYSMLQELDREKHNIVSLEDPIEYNVEGINQSQVMPEIDYDFINGLRSILRQDPDMIMVGEIRDKKTAELAVQAALTGHLVFSTLHTNSSVGVVTRLIDMGIDPYLIAPTLLLSIGQRLVRTLCKGSTEEIIIDAKLKERIDLELAEVPDEIKKTIKIPANIYQGIPSPSCPQGSKGRMGVFEVLSKTKELEKVIITNPNEQDIMKEFRRQGMVTMKEDAVIKLLDGVIGIDELNKL